MSTPQSIIYLLTKGNQLSVDQHHTFMFANATAQRNYFFESGTYIEINPTQYVRVSSNEVKIPKAKEEIEGHYSYICIKTFQDLPAGQTGTRYWYAFIVETEYVSDRCTKITYEIDTLQTFLFDGSVNFKSAHVERCHWNTDVAGDNRVAEPFSVPSYVANEIQEDYFHSGCIIGIVRGTEQVYAAGATITTESRFYYNSSIASGSQFFGYNLSNSGHRAELKRMLESLNDEDGVITDFYYCPWEIMQNSVTAGYEMTDTAVAAIIPTINITKFGSGSTLNKLENYTPKNNKLYTYPYNVLAVNNTTGDEMILKFEEFNNSIPELRIEGTWLAKPACSIIPTNYEKEPKNYRYGISLKDYPLFSYASNAYNTWLAQKSQSELVSAGFGLVSKTLGAALTASFLSTVAPPVGAVAGIAALTSFLSSTGTIVSDAVEAYNKPDKLVSDIVGGTLTIGNQHDGFKFSRLSINGYFAEILDNYFTQYGYAQNRIIDIDNWLFPNSGKIRPHYKYIKTSDIHVNGSCSAKHKANIETIFNRGITFWETDTAIGDYSVNNAASTHNP